MPKQTTERPNDGGSYKRDKSGKLTRLDTPQKPDPGKSVRRKRDAQAEKATGKSDAEAEKATGKSDPKADKPAEKPTDNVRTLRDKKE